VEKIKIVVNFCMEALVRADEWLLDARLDGFFGGEGHPPFDFLLVLEVVQFGDVEVSSTALEDAAGDKMPLCLGGHRLNHQ